MDESHLNPDMSDRTLALMADHVASTTLRLNQFLDSHGVSLPVLGKAMDAFTRQVIDLPQEAACKIGCSYCCHLRVDVSIPELLVIFYEVYDLNLPDITFLKTRIQEITSKGNVLEKGFWHFTQERCPFLADDHTCAIYSIRPFACRAYHSMDKTVCRQGFEDRCSVEIPCFPLFRAMTDMFSSVFIKVLADKGYASYPIGFVKGLDMLLNDPSLVDQWLDQKDVFTPARI